MRNDTRNNYKCRSKRHGTWEHYREINTDSPVCRNTFERRPRSMHFSFNSQSDDGSSHYHHCLPAKISRFIPRLQVGQWNVAKTRCTDSDFLPRDPINFHLAPYLSGVFAVPRQTRIKVPLQVWTDCTLAGFIQWCCIRVDEFASRWKKFALFPGLFCFQVDMKGLLRSRAVEIKRLT